MYNSLRPLGRNRRIMLHRITLRHCATVLVAYVLVAYTAMVSAYAQAPAGKQAPAGGCASLPKYADLKAALAAATSAETSGLNNQMWGTIVDRDGIVCAIAFSGKARGSQWPGSRVISAQKANTANAFGLDSSSSSSGSGQAKGLARF